MSEARYRDECSSLSKHLLSLYAEALKQKRRLVVSIDGRCGCGKSTLALELARMLEGEHHVSCDVIHLDDFFLPLARRTAERTAFPGWAVDIERFNDEVAPFLRMLSDFEYGVFDCSCQSITSTKRVSAGLVIVEGAYSMRPEWRALYDISVFVTACSSVQLERLQIRVGDERLEAFKRQWIPLEEEYFDAFGVEAACDFKFNT